MSDNLTLQQVLDYGQDVWPANNLYAVGQLAYALRSGGEEAIAFKLENFKARMEEYILQEFRADPYVSDETYRDYSSDRNGASGLL